jgi:hypothetical protein
VNTTFVGVEALIVIGDDVAVVSPDDVAESVSPTPGAVALTPANVATPATAATVVVPDSDPELMPSDTDAVEEVTVLPKASCTVTTGCVLKATPAKVGVEGCVVNANCDGAPAVIAKVDDVAEVNADDEAVSDRPVPTVVTLTPLNVARPLTALTTSVPCSPGTPDSVTDAVDDVTRFQRHTRGRR